MPLAAEIDTTPQRVGLQVNGPGGGQWEIAVDHDRAVAQVPGLSDDRQPLIYLNSHTFTRLGRNEISVNDSLRQGQISFEGNDLRQRDLVGLLDQLVRTGSN